jgi:CHAD domain-containing protein
MATNATALPGATEQRGLAHWMDRVLRELDNLQRSPDKNAVHDLRVAIRRCRSVGAVMREVDPDPSWLELRGAPKKLFRKLGELRDTQIMDQWLGEHAAENDKLRILLHGFFRAKEPKLLEEALRLADKFDAKNWNRLERKLRKRARLVPSGSLTAQCLAVERLQEAKELHGKTLRARRPESWHALRIGLKKFRYTVESLLPQQYEQWSPQLKRLQDLLGEVHDLDVLSGIVKENASSGELATLRLEWERTMERERSARLAEYRELAAGKNSFWQQWRRALPQRERLELAAAARLRSTARATSTRTRRATQVSRLALGIFDALHRAQTAPAFDGTVERRVLQSAARLCGMRFKGASNPPQKAARRFLLSLPAPPSWQPGEWDLLAWTVRYYRGAEPNGSGAFSELPEEQRTDVRALAGVLRLARGLRKCGIPNSNGLRAEKTAAAVVLYVPGLEDSAENAARLAAAKHLLDGYLGKPLLLIPAPKPEKVVALPPPEETQFRIATASD